MKDYLSLIKFSHTVFAMPFAFVGFFLATYFHGDGLSWNLLLLVLLCMVFARSAAMAFNRYLDRDVDKENPRTAQREIPAGVISPKAALWFIVVNSVLFVVTTWFINMLCFLLSPIALMVILGYSYTKRFTFLCHFVLGLGLSLAPIGAWIAVTGRFEALPLLYSAAVLLWVAGFDIIYALQDESFDRAHALKSVPVIMGKADGLRLSKVLHVLSGLLILYGSWWLDQMTEAFGLWHWLGTVCFLGLLIYQHTLVKANDLSRVNLAFFTTNGIAGVAFGALMVLDIYL
jgi:4-hydroxybenzoate polyprenyltransferase